MENTIAKIQELISVFGLKIIAALAIFIIGKWAARLIKKITHKILTAKNVDPTIISFVENLVYIITVTFVVLAALGKLGVQTTSFVAIIGAAGLAIGLALQGTLSNTISGIVLSLRKNIRVGDWIETNDFKGEVIQITLNYLVLKESDNNIVVIPNKTILESPMKNYSQTSKMRVVLECGVAYDTDLEKVRGITTKLIADRFGNERIKEDPEFYFTEFGSSSINFMCRFWIYGENGLAKLKARSELIIELKKAFDKHDIQIPFPIRTLEFKNQEIMEPSISF